MDEALTLARRLTGNEGTWTGSGPWQGTRARQGRSRQGHLSERRGRRLGRALYWAREGARKIPARALQYCVHYHLVLCTLSGLARCRVADCHRLAGLTVALASTTPLRPARTGSCCSPDARTRSQTPAQPVPAARTRTRPPVTPAPRRSLSPPARPASARSDSSASMSDAELDYSSEYEDYQDDVEFDDDMAGQSSLTRGPQGLGDRLDASRYLS